MKYQVQFTAQARLEFFEAALWWADHRDVDQAASWIEQFEAAIDRLNVDPERHAQIHEQDLYEWRYTYRQILFGLSGKATHRAVFCVRDDRV